MASRPEQPMKAGHKHGSSEKGPVAWIKDYCQSRKWFMKYEVFDLRTNCRDSDIQVQLYIEQPGVRVFTTISTDKSKRWAKYNAAHLMKIQFQAAQQKLNAEPPGFTTGWPEKPIVIPTGRFETRLIRPKSTNKKTIRPPPPPIFHRRPYDEENYVGILAQYCAGNEFARPVYEKKWVWEQPHMKVYMRCIVERPGLAVPFRSDWLKYRMTQVDTKKYVAYSMLIQIRDHMDRFYPPRDSEVLPPQINAFQHKPRTIVAESAVEQMNKALPAKQINVAKPVEQINLAEAVGQINTAKPVEQVNDAEPIPEANAVESESEPEDNVDMDDTLSALTLYHFMLFFVSVACLLTALYCFSLITV